MVSAVLQSQEIAGLLNSFIFVISFQKDSVNRRSGTVGLPKSDPKHSDQWMTNTMFMIIKN